MVLGSLSCWVSEKTKAFSRVLPSSSAPSPILSDAMATTVSVRASGVQTGASASASTGSPTVRRTRYSRSPSFSAADLQPFCLAIFVRFWTAISLSTSTSTSPAPASAAMAFFALTTGSGQASPLASTFSMIFPLYRTFYRKARN